MDGARVFHAAAYLNCDVKEIAQHCDSIQFCLSKGLCAPVGSIIAGTADFIEKCVYIRKLLGGGMRQCGIIAAAGLVALKEQRKFLKKDLEMRKMLEEELEKCEFV